MRGDGDGGGEEAGVEEEREVVEAMGVVGEDEMEVVEEDLVEVDPRVERDLEVEMVEEDDLRGEVEGDNHCDYHRVHRYRGSPE